MKTHFERFFLLINHDVSEQPPIQEDPSAMTFGAQLDVVYGKSRVTPHEKRPNAAGTGRKRVKDVSRLGGTDSGVSSRVSFMVEFGGAKQQKSCNAGETKSVKTARPLPFLPVMKTENAQESK